MNKFTTLTSAIAISAIGAVSAQGASVMRIDVNEGILSRAEGSFDTNYTGDLNISDDSATEIRDILKGDVNDTASVFGQYNGDLVDYDGTVSFLNGEVTGGEFSLTLANGDAYQADLIAKGDLQEQVDVTQQSFVFSAGSANGMFTDGNGDNAFGGVDISDFLAQNGELDGSLVSMQYNGSVRDNEVASEIGITTVPTPSAAGLGGAMLLVLTGGRSLRRRKRA